MDGPNTPAAYTAKATQYARKMREVDPEIVLFASGAYNPEYDYREWLAELPKLAAMCAALTSNITQVTNDLIFPSKRWIFFILMG